MTSVVPNLSTMQMSGMLKQILFMQATHINELAAEIHNGNVKAGWWHDIQTGQPIIERPHVIGEKLMLCVSELAEAMEGHRKNLNDDKLPHRKMIEVEIGDLIIRALDICGALKLDIGGAIVEKLNYNSTREDHKMESRKQENGKKY